jgi:hypothetical protein
VQHILRTICKSRTYQLSIATNEWNEDDTINYSHAPSRAGCRRVLFDAIHLRRRAAEAAGRARRLPRGAIPDAGVADAVFGRLRPAGARKRLRVRTQSGMVLGR